MSRGRVRGKRLILAYHGVIPHGENPQGERALFMTQRDFASHLDLLSEVADVSPLDQIDEEGDGRPRVAITLDDAYRGALREGVGELVKRGLPATIFVAPGRLNGHVFWWDALSSSDGAIDPAVRDHALHALAGSDERIREWAASSPLQISASMPPYAQAATRDELGAALSFPGITVGSHTWSHANLATLGADDLAREVKRSRAWLKAEFPEKAIDWLAYPYGLHSDAARGAVANASYIGGLRITGGWHRPAQVSPFSRPRLNVPAGLSVTGLKARLFGALPT